MLAAAEACSGGLGQAWVCLCLCCNALAHHTLLLSGIMPLLEPPLHSSAVLHCAALYVQDCKDSPDSWMSTEQFNAGLALAQAMPGPLFNFAAYLGAVIAQNAGVNAIIGGCCGGAAAAGRRGLAECVCSFVAS